MTDSQLQFLKEILATQSVSGDEWRLVHFITNHLKEMSQTQPITFSVDELGNILVTKGDAEFYPLLVAHTDTVHPLFNGEIIIKEELQPNSNGDLKRALKGYRSDNGHPTGCGGDDKSGVFICLELLKQFQNIKVLFAASEETGCHGSEHTVTTSPDFFSDVGYAINFDSPCGNTLSETLMGIELNDEEKEFRQITTPILLQHKITKWQEHSYTDVMVIREHLDVACLNLAGGYYNSHTTEEYVVVEDVSNSLELGTKLIEALGCKSYFEGYEHASSSIPDDELEDYYEDIYLEC